MRRGGGEEGEEGRCGEGTAPTGRLRAGERRLTTGRGPTAPLTAPPPAEAASTAALRWSGWAGARFSRARGGAEAGNAASGGTAVTAGSLGSW